MGGRQLEITQHAVDLVTKKGWSVTHAAQECGVAITTVRRALRRAGVAPLRRGPKKLRSKSTSQKSKKS
jgi:transposase